jgi:NADPH:quinone reductase-like Zn-dependent oxidoreductase
MKAWQYSSTKGGLEKNLKLNASAAVPKAKSSQHLVQIFHTALNPVDYKPAEIPYVGRMIVPNLATPGVDFAGRIVTPASGSSLKAGQLVFGMAGSPLAGAALREYTVIENEGIAALPEGVAPVDAATVGVAGLTAYQAIVPKVKKGDRIFINGGSGGTGVFGIQIAKAVGCYVTTSCSTANVGLCKELGADEVIDYKKTSIVEALIASPEKFDHVVDNVGADTQLYWRCHEYTKPEAVFVQVARSRWLKNVTDAFKIQLLPGFLGGGKRKQEGFLAKPNARDLEQIGTWMKEGKVKAVIDQRFPFEEAPKAFEKLKTGRAKGKIVVDVAPET